MDGEAHKIIMQIWALSPVSIENARLNMATEVPGWDFEYIARAAETSWEKELKKIIIQGTDLQKKQ